MGNKVISIGLNTKDITRAIKEVEEYKRDILRKEKLLLEKLSYIGVKEASVRFTTAMYDGVNDSSVSLEQTSNGYAIVAQGSAVAFIEFGTGVYHNPGEPYPNPRPPGIVGIGEYGKGKGKRRAWGYRDEGGEVVITRGNPASMPLWYATEEMRRSILQIAREVFG